MSTGCILLSLWERAGGEIQLALSLTLSQRESEPFLNALPMPKRMGSFSTG